MSTFGVPTFIYGVMICQSNKHSHVHAEEMCLGQFRKQFIKINKQAAVT